MSCMGAGASSNGLSPWLLETHAEHGRKSPVSPGPGPGPEGGRGRCPESINCLALSDDPEASLIASGSDDCSVRVWTTNTARCANIATLEGHSKSPSPPTTPLSCHHRPGALCRYITSVAVSSGFVYSASADRTIRKWDLGTGSCIFTYEGHFGQVNRIIVTGDFLFRHAP